jgi:hypothetical protein
MRRVWGGGLAMVVFFWILPVLLVILLPAKEGAAELGADAYGAVCTGRCTGRCTSV